MSYTSFRDNWLGRSVDFDHVFGKQCVDLIRQYMCDEFGLVNGVYGNAIDYWTRPTSAVLTKFFLVGGADAQQGDVVVLNGLAGNPYGHIGICDSADANTITILEQNGAGGGTGEGPNAIRLRAVSKSRVAGLLRPLGVPTPAPTVPNARSTVSLPASVRSWRVYRIGSNLRPNTSDQIGVLAPAMFGGLTYKIEAWVGDYAVVITTQSFGRGVIWVKGTEAVIN